MRTPEKSEPKASSIGPRNDPRISPPRLICSTMLNSMPESLLEGFARWFRLSRSLGSRIYGVPAEILNEVR